MTALFVGASTRVGILAWCLLWALPVAVQDTFSGKCVGVTDGDTITVLREGGEVKARLEGIDTPERGDDYSQKAKKFLSALVFGKQVSVRDQGQDRYGRTIGRVSVGGKAATCAE